MTTMQCENAQELLGAWQDGELPLASAWRVARHVRSCPHCTAEALALSRFNGRLRAADPLVAVPLVAEKTVHPERLPRLTPVGRPALAGMALAAVAIAALGYTYFPTRVPTQKIVQRQPEALPTTNNSAPVKKLQVTAEASGARGNIPERQAHPVRLSHHDAQAETSHSTNQPTHRRHRKRRSGRAGRTMLAVVPSATAHKTQQPITVTAALPVPEEEILIISARTLTPAEMEAQGQVLLIDSKPALPPPSTGWVAAITRPTTDISTETPLSNPEELP